MTVLVRLAWPLEEITVDVTQDIRGFFDSLKIEKHISVNNTYLIEDINNNKVQNLNLNKKYYIAPY